MRKYKKCENCGAIRWTRKTYHCDHCGKLVCLDCYNFVLKICANCETLGYTEKYKGKIELYQEGKVFIEV